MGKFKLLYTIFLCFILLLINTSDIYALDECEPDQPGSYAVGFYPVNYTVDEKTYHATIRYPAEYNGRLAPIIDTDETFPGIVVSNGKGGSKWTISWIAEHLTSHGFVTLCFTPPELLSNDINMWSKGFNAGIKTLKKEKADRFPESNIFGDKFGVIGFSIGGGGCIKATALDPQIGACVALAPYGGTFFARYITNPVLLLTGSKDYVISPRRVEKTYNNVGKKIMF